MPSWRSPPVDEIDKAAEQRVEALGVLAIAEMAGLIEDMDLGLALMRADHLEQVKGAFGRHCRVVASEHDLGRPLQAAFAQPLQRFALLLGKLRREKTDAELLVDHF